jgi:prepilin-type N-terminal cleavage/methylation domain-containing protein
MSSHPTSCARGFTLVELLVVMGILSGFLLMLVQLVDGGLSMFSEGELGQVMTDRASRAQRVLQDELRQLRSSASGRERQAADDRLVVQMLPIGLPARPERGATRIPMLRGAVRLHPDREIELLGPLLLARVAEESPELPLDAARAEAERLAQQEPLRGVGNVLLVPWPQSGNDDALLELRAAWFLPGQRVPVGQGRFVDPFAVPLPGSADLPALLVHGMTRPILQDLLHVELLLWAQTTRSWTEPLAESLAGDGPAGATHDGPLRCWDSARGGWLVDRNAGGAFPFDRGPASEAEPGDDVHPHAILVRCIVAQPRDAPVEGLLAVALGADENVLVLYDGDRFLGDPNGGYVKVGAEWIRYEERSGDRLRGLRRGQRHTRALEHPAGARVHLGRMVEFVVPVLHQKDDWNG